MENAPTRIFTIGHSTRSLKDFLSLLSENRIETLEDIRRWPSSAKWPHFNRESLSNALRGADIEYMWMETLGGYRKEVPGGDLSQCGAEGARVQKLR